MTPGTGMLALLDTDRPQKAFPVKDLVLLSPSPAAIREKEKTAAKAKKKEKGAPKRKGKKKRTPAS